MIRNLTWRYPRDAHVPASCLSFNESTPTWPSINPFKSERWSSVCDRSKAMTLGWCLRFWSLFHVFFCIFVLFISFGCLSFGLSFAELYVGLTLPRHPRDLCGLPQILHSSFLSITLAPIWRDDTAIRETVRPFDLRKAHKTFLLFLQDLLLIEQKVLQGIQFLARLGKISQEYPCVQILARKILRKSNSPSFFLCAHFCPM